MCLSMENASTEVLLESTCTDLLFDHIQEGDLPHCTQPLKVLDCK